MERVQRQLPPGDAASLLCDGRTGVERLDAPETFAWRDWPGRRLSPQAILGEAFGAGVAWQCVAALDALLRSLPRCLAPGGRVVILTFHSGEDRRVKKAFQSGARSGVYAAAANRVVRSAKAETWSNRRASSAKLRWAVRAPA